MKKYLTVYVSFLMTAAFADDVSFLMLVGPLRDSSGVELADGSLIQILYVKDGGTSISTDQLSAGNFLNSDEQLLYSFSLDSSTTGVAGSFNVNLPDFELKDDLVAGAAIFMRWWPTLNVTSTSPSIGDEYGQTNPLFVVGWNVPSSGEISLNYFDTLVGGNVPTGDMKANYQVVPEPSTYALGGVVLLGALVAVRRRKRG